MALVPSSSDTTTDPNSIVLSGPRRLDTFQKHVKSLFGFIEKVSKTIGCANNMPYQKFREYKITFNKLIKQHGNVAVEKFLTEWSSLYERVETSLLVEEYTVFASDWVDPTKMLVIYGNGKLKGINKQLPLYFFIKKLLEKKTAVEAMMLSCANDDDAIIGDIDAIDRALEFKLHLFRVFSTIVQEESDAKLVKSIIDDLESHLDVAPVVPDSAPGGIMENLMSYVTPLLGGNGAKPALPDLSQLKNFIGDKPELMGAVTETLGQMQGCNSQMELIQKLGGIMRDKELQQTVVEGLGGTYDPNESNPFDMIGQLVGQFTAGGTADRDDGIIDHEY